MSKAVMLSIRQKWVEKIARGEKTIEVRKTRPKMDTPYPGGHHNGHYPDQCRDHQRHDRALRRG